MAGDDPQWLRKAFWTAIIGAVITTIIGLPLLAWQKEVWIFAGNVTKHVSLVEPMSPSADCFTSIERPEASLTFKGSRSERERNKFIQCGSFQSPKLASGIYHFVYRAYPEDSRLVEVTALESSNASQARTTATWVISYRGDEICRVEAQFGEPQEIECDVDVEETKADLTELTIEQKVSPSSLRRNDELWAGLLEPFAVIEIPK
jgi:hypothetical protein